MIFTWKSQDTGSRQVGIRERPRVLLESDDVFGNIRYVLAAAEDDCFQDVRSPAGPALVILVFAVHQ